MVQPVLTVAERKTIVGAPGEVVGNVVCADAVCIAGIEVVLDDRAAPGSIFSIEKTGTVIHALRPRIRGDRRKRLREALLELHEESVVVGVSSRRRVVP